MALEGEKFVPMGKPDDPDLICERCGAVPALYDEETERSLCFECLAEFHVDVLAEWDAYHREVTG